MASVVRALPTRFELRCGGASLIIAQLLWCAAFFLQAMDHDLYAVASEEEVETAHAKISSSAHRLEIEISCVCLWISYPLLLIAIHSITKLANASLSSTPAESMMYVAEKAYIAGVTLCVVLVPAISLLTVSFPWNLAHQTNTDTDTGTGTDTLNATGYWIQLAFIWLEMELVDCLAVADAVFMLSYFASAAYFIYAERAGNVFYTQIAGVLHTGASCQFRCCIEMLTCCFSVSLFVVFLIVLFEFATSGFFSPTGYAGFCIVWSFLVKMFIGLRMLMISSLAKYNELKKVFEKQRKRLAARQTTDDAVKDSSQNYKMEAISTTVDVNVTSTD